MKQTTLFEKFAEPLTPPKARRSHPHTSVVAAQQHESSGQSDSDRGAILSLMRSRKNLGPDGFPLHGWTSGEIAAALGEGWDNVRASRRLPELETLGHILGSKARTAARRCMVKGSMMITWHISE